MRRYPKRWTARGDAAREARPARPARRRTWRRGGEADGGPASCARAAPSGAAIPSSDDAEARMRRPRGPPGGSRQKTTSVNRECHRPGHRIETGNRAGFRSGRRRTDARALLPLPSLAARGALADARLDARVGRDVRRRRPEPRVRPRGRLRGRRGGALAPPRVAPVRARPSRPAAAAFRADSPARVVPAPRLLPVPRPVVRRPSRPPPPADLRHPPSPTRPPPTPKPRRAADQGWVVGAYLVGAADARRAIVVAADAPGWRAKGARAVRAPPRRGRHPGRDPGPLARGHVVRRPVPRGARENRRLPRVGEGHRPGEDRRGPPAPSSPRSENAAPNASPSSASASARTPSRTSPPPGTKRVRKRLRPRRRPRAKQQPPRRPPRRRRRRIAAETRTRRARWCARWISTPAAAGETAAAAKPPALFVWGGGEEQDAARAAIDFIAEERAGDAEEGKWASEAFADAAADFAFAEEGDEAAERARGGAGAALDVPGGSRRPDERGGEREDDDRAGVSGGVCVISTCERRRRR